MDDSEKLEALVEICAAQRTQINRLYSVVVTVLSDRSGVPRDIKRYKVARAQSDALFAAMAEAMDDDESEDESDE